MSAFEMWLEEIGDGVWIDEAWHEIGAHLRGETAEFRSVYNATRVEVKDRTATVTIIYFPGSAERMTLDEFADRVEATVEVEAPECAAVLRQIRATWPR